MSELLGVPLSENMPSFSDKPIRGVIFDLDGETASCAALVHDSAECYIGLTRAQQYALGYPFAGVLTGKLVRLCDPFVISAISPWFLCTYDL